MDETTVLAALTTLPLSLLVVASAPGEVASSAPTGTPESATDLAAGAAAPAGRWYVRGGCAARTSVSLSPPVRREPEVAWTHPVRGEIEDEPLVWDERVVLSVLEPSGRRVALVLSSVSGELLSSLPVVATGPLRPALWGPYLALQPESGRIDVHRVSTRRPILVRSFESRDGFSAPLLFEDALYVREGDALARYDLDHREPRWRVGAPMQGGVFRGGPSLRGQLAYAVAYDPAGGAWLVVLDRESGRVVDTERVAHHDGTIPAPGDELEISVLAGQAFVRFPLPVPARGDRVYQSAGLALRPDGRPVAGRAASVHDFATAPAAWKDGWMVLDRASARGPAWVAGRGAGDTIESVVLADSTSQSELLASAVRPVRARDVAFVDRLAFDVEEFDILWKLRTPPRFPPVPGGGLLLVVDARDRLTALREELPLPSRAEVAAVEMAAQLERRLAESYARLALESVRASDPELTSRLIREARSRETTSRDLLLAEDGYERMVTAERPAARDERAARAIEAQEEALRAQLLERLVAEARATRDDELRRTLLRTVLEREPDNAGAAGLVRGMLPDGADPLEPLDAASWLDFLDASSRSPVTIVRPEERPETDPAARALTRERRLWRDDLRGFESANLIVLAPPDVPGAVAKALDLGELVCGALEQIFAPIASDPGRRPPQPGERLMLFLYGDRETYIAQSQRNLSAPEVARGWSAGHYSAAENLSRMFVPDDDEQSVRLLSTYVHELTHHWLATRSPTWSRDRSDVAPDSRGQYWIVEGLATMVEEFLWDPEARAWSPDNPRAASLDTIANAREDQLIPWREFFSTTKLHFLELENDPDRPVSLSWKLGTVSYKSEIRMFYAQAGAVCHFLFRAEGGRYREELLRFWSDWYGGKESYRTYGRWQTGPGKLGIDTRNFARAEVER